MTSTDRKPADHAQLQLECEELRRRVAELETEHSLLSQVAINVAEGIYLVSVSDLTIRYANPTMEKMFGYGPGEMIGKHVSTINAPSGGDPVRTAAQIEEALQSRGFYRGDVLTMKKDGTPFWSQTTISRMNHTFHGEVYVSLQADISERKRVEEALLVSEGRYRRANAVARIGNWEWNVPGDTMYWDEELYRISGLPSDVPPSLEGFLSIVHPDDRERVHSSVLKALDGGIYDLDFRLVRPDGTVRVAHTIGGVIFQEAGQPRLMFGAVQDITERKRAEEKLKESEARYRTIFDNAGDYVLLFEMDSTGMPVIIEMNEAALAQHGFTREEMVGMPITFLDPDVTPESNAQRIQSLERDGTALFAVRHRRRDGSEFNVEVKAVFIKVGAKRLILALERDITERKKAEELLKESEERYRALSDLAADGIMIHERGIVLDANKAFGEIIGRPSAELIGKNFFEVVPLTPESRRLVVDHSQIESNASYEVVIDRPDGRRVYAETTGRNGLYRGRKVRMVSLRDRTAQHENEAALRASEERYRTLVETAQEGIIAVDPNHVITFANDQAAELFGYSVEEMLGKEVGEFVDPEDRESYEFERERRSHGRHSLFERNYRRKDGRKVTALVSASAIVDAEGRFQGAVSLLTDVTERKRIEEDLLESEARYRLLIEHSPSAIILHRDGCFLYANPAGLELFGAQTQEQLVGTPLLDRVHPDHRDVVTNRVDNALGQGESGVAPRIEEKLLKLDGEVIFGEVSGVAINYQGQPAMLTSVQDITARKRVEEESRLNEARLRSLVEIQQHQAATIQEMLDFALEESLKLTGSEIGYIYFYDEDKQEFTLNTWSKSVMELCSVLEPRTTYRLEKTGLWGEVVRQRRPIVLNDYSSSSPWKKGCPEGHAPLSRFLTVPVFHDDRIVAVVGQGNKKNPYVETDILQVTLLMDSVWKIVERKQSDEEKARLEAQLQQAMKMEAIGRLAGGVAHDFNNLLTGIKGNVELALLDLQSHDPLVETLKEIDKAAESAASLTKQLLAFSRKQLIEPKLLDINELITNSQRMLTRLIGEDVTLTTHLGQTIGTVKVDPGQFEQIIVNLAVNARDAMPDGGKLILETTNVDLDDEYVHNHPTAQPGDYVLLAVSDTGQGMDKEVRSHLFEPFFTTKEKGKGTGLGLAMIYGAVRQSGGFVEVYSEPGQGTTFKIYLPRIEEKAEKLGKEVKLTEIPTGNETILVVEDEAIVRDLAVRVLKRLGYEVLHADSGGDALVIAERYQEPIHLLLTDVIMPGMNGKELANRVSKLHPEIKVLFTSGYTENVIAHHGVVDADLNFIGKPYAPHALAKKIRSVLTNT